MSAARQGLSSAIRAARERAGLTQSQLADRVGLAPSHIARLETGDRANPRFETIARIAHALGASLDEIASAAGLATVAPESNSRYRAGAVRSAQALRDLLESHDQERSVLKDAVDVLEAISGDRGRRSHPRR
ncbi:MAG: helix-turn-helix transcriptional regulator [bacterium]|nr:helix-turn-helix transcriptional regulator [bacterium]